jgi:RNA binding activity-knot of a chromodomain
MAPYSWLLVQFGAENQNVVPDVSLNELTEIPPEGGFDRSQLKVGDPIDGYCNKTLRWYEAKVVDCKDKDGQGMLKIHFLGWNSKFDEWLPRNSERIVARGSSRAIVLEAVKKASSLVPWWDSDTLLSRAKLELGYAETTRLPERRRADVCIDGIEDWCIDYTYANPSLWLISASGAWYRVAGPLCAGLAGGHLGSPSPVYAPVFQQTRTAYLSCVHVAMCLLDFLPSMPKLAFKQVCEEVETRSGGSICDIDILENHNLIEGKSIFC